MRPRRRRAARASCCRRAPWCISAISCSRGRGRWPRRASTATRSSARRPTWPSTACCTCWATTTKARPMRSSCAPTRRRSWSGSDCRGEQHTPRLRGGAGDVLPLLPEQRERAGALAPRRLRRSFGAAFAGLGHLLRHEPNAQIHAALAAVATALGLWLGRTPPGWALLMALFGLVIGLEAMNTVAEGLADLAMPRRDPRVATIKDVAAGGVLAAALAALAAGLFLFGPRLWRLFGG